MFCSNKLVDENKDYFSEKEMKRRCPILYEEYIGKHLSEEEKLRQAKEFDKADCRFVWCSFVEILYLSSAKCYHLIEL